MNLIHSHLLYNISNPLHPVSKFTLSFLLWKFFKFLCANLYLMMIIICCVVVVLLCCYCYCFQPPRFFVCWRLTLFYFQKHSTIEHTMWFSFAFSGCLLGKMEGYILRKVHTLNSFHYIRQIFHNDELCAILSYFHEHFLGIFQWERD